MADKDRSLEVLIGRYWTQTIGIVIILIGAVLFTYYSITHELITPTMRITLGLLFGGSLIALSLYLQKHYALWSLALCGGGAALLYISFYAAYWMGPASAEAWIRPIFTAYGSIVGVTLTSALVCILALTYQKEFFAIFSLLCCIAVPYAYASISLKVFTIMYVIIILVSYFAISYTQRWNITYKLTLFGCIFAALLNFAEHIIPRIESISNDHIAGPLDYWHIILAALFFILYYLVPALITAVRINNTYNASQTCTIVASLISFLGLSQLNLPLWINTLIKTLHISNIIFISISMGSIALLGTLILFSRKAKNLSLLATSFFLTCAFYIVAVFSQWNINQFTLKNLHSSYAVITIAAVIVMSLFVTMAWIAHYYRNNFPDYEYTIRYALTAAFVTLFTWFHTPLFGFPYTLLAILGAAIILAFVAEFFGFALYAAAAYGLASLFHLARWFDWLKGASPYNIPAIKHLTIVYVLYIILCIFILRAKKTLRLDEQEKHTFEIIVTYILMTFIAIFGINCIHTYILPNNHPFLPEALATWFGVYGLTLILIGMARHKSFVRFFGGVSIAISLLYVAHIVYKTQNTLIQIGTVIFIGILLVTLSFVYQWYKKYMDA